MDISKNKGILFFISTPLPPFKGGRNFGVGAKPLRQTPLSFMIFYANSELIEVSL